jgi:hypothetical protein
MNKLQKTDVLFNKITSIIEQARQKVATAVNLAMVYTHFEIGRYIVKDGQQGEQRAEYGKTVLKELSERLTDKFGSGFSAENLLLMRKFFLTYHNFVITDYEIDQKKVITDYPIDQTAPLPKFTLSWTHYLILMRIDNADARRFYEIEAAQQQWSVRQLARQTASSLYERLALSRNKKELIRLANEGQTVEKPTVGILLCETANQTLVELTLSENANIYAAQYALYLPDKKLLQQKLKEWTQEFDNFKGANNE